MVCVVGRVIPLLLFLPFCQVRAIGVLQQFFLPPPHSLTTCIPFRLLSGLQSVAWNTLWIAAALIHLY